MQLKIKEGQIQTEGQMKSKHFLLAVKENSRLLKLGYCCCINLGY